MTFPEGHIMSKWLDGGLKLQLTGLQSVATWVLPFPAPA